MEGYCVSPYATPDERAAIIFDRVYEALGDPETRRRITVTTGSTERERAAAVLRFVQSLGYVPDPSDCDRYAPIKYTLEHGGDCDDLTPTVIASAYASGLRGSLVYMSQPKKPQDHVTAKILVDDEWLWAEPSIHGARLGEHPYEAVERVGYTERVTGALGTRDRGGLIVAGLLAIAAVGYVFTGGARLE